MRRVFAKGLDCLHHMLGCKCPPEPIAMKLRTLAKPTNGFAVLCAYYTAHGRSNLRSHFTFVDDKMERRVQLACGYCVPKSGELYDNRKGLLVESHYTIHSDGRVTDHQGVTIGRIAPLVEAAA